MELCTPRAFSNLPHLHNHNINSSNQLLSPTTQPHLRWRPSLPLKPTSISLSKQGLQSYKFSSLKSSASDETSSVTSQYVKDESEGVITFEDRQPSEEKEYGQSTLNEAPQDESVGVITVEDRSQSEDKEYGETVEDETPQEDSSLDAQKKIREFLAQLNLKIDSEDDTYSILPFGGTAIAALWLASAVVGAIDSIPLFPKLMEVVGLGYTVWFSTRYLIFKRNRDELVAKIEELKQQVLGTKDD